MRSFHVQGKKIIGVAANYASHIQEMNGTIPKEPIFFLKPTTSYILEPNPIYIPEHHQVHHEVELGVVIGRGAANIKVENAKDHIAGFVLALDLTARDLQREAKQAGLPWTLSKGFDTFCPVSAYLSKSMLYRPEEIDLWLKVNGEVRQRGNTKDMIFPIEQLISKISEVMRLEPGDLILTGTPSGVGPVQAGDVIDAGLGHDYLKMRFRAVPKPKVLHK